MKYNDQIMKVAFNILQLLHPHSPDSAFSRTLLTVFAVLFLPLIHAGPLQATEEVILAEARGIRSLVTLTDWQEALADLPPSKRKSLTRKEHLDLLDVLIAERLADREAIREAASRNSDAPQLAVALRDFRRQTLITAWLAKLHREEMKNGGSDDERTSRVAARLADDHASWLARHPLTTSGDTLAIGPDTRFFEAEFLQKPLYHLTASGDITGLDFAALLHGRKIDGNHLRKSGSVNRLLDRMVKEVVTCRIAEENGLARDPGIRLILDEGERKLRREAWMKQVMPEFTISTAEIEICYRNHSREIGDPDQLEGSLILVKGLTEAVELKQQLEAGKPFAELAREHSLHASAKLGGKLPLLPDRNLPSPFSALSGRQPGDTVGPLTMTEGVYLLRLDDLHPGQRPSLEEIAPAIRQDLVLRRSRQFRETLLNDLKTRHQVKSYPERIP